MSSKSQSQINSTLLGRLNLVVQRERYRRICIFLAVAWVGVAIVGCAILFINRSATSNVDAFVPEAWFWLGISSIVVTILALVLAIVTSRSVAQIAHRLESEFPELDSVLITAIEQDSNESDALGFLQQDVIRTAVYHSYDKDWKSIFPSGQILLTSAVAVIGVLSLMAAGILLLFTRTPGENASVHLFDDVEIKDRIDYQLTVQPGDTEIERGTSLLVLAQFSHELPPRAELSYTATDGTERTIQMTKSLDDPLFASRISQVDQPLTYRIAYDQQLSEEFAVKVFEFPRLVRGDADLSFPTYTQLPVKTLQDIRRISAVVGTEVAFKFFVNKPVVTATLVVDDDETGGMELGQDPDDPLLWTRKITVDRSLKFHLQLVDDQGRENKTPPRFTINALINQPPRIELVEPARDIQVSAIQEIDLHATAWDDFGLQTVGLTYSIGGDSANDLVLSRSIQGKQKHPVDYLMELEQIDAEPDQLVAYHFWAEDFGPDGQPRRTASDMFFAEVRRFEEIYRQAQGGGQQGQQNQDQDQSGNQNAEQAMQLAELQKEIINATWRVIRRETRPEASPEFQKDVQLLIESQNSAASQVDEFAQKLQDAESRELADQLKSYISEALAELNNAKNADSAVPLAQAIRHQQAAYQMLLKMRAREYQVQQSSQSQSRQSSSSQSPQQRQMQQMELQNQVDQYEQQRLAQDQQQQSEQQRENRQILSRLRELARRQNDLNKRIKELQSALEEAESEDEKEEIEKQLKRLQEQQQQILRDTDQLQQRMQQPENQERMSEAAQQLEKARQNVQQSSEALQNGQVTRAAAAGTRAERDLKELRDEFQKRTSGQFSQQMRQMRNQARDLQQQQQDLAQQLEDRNQNSRPANSLESKDDRTEIAKAMEDGQSTIEDLSNQIKKTIEEAEEFEPLLADELYDTYRDTQQSRPDRALESARRSIQQGITDDAIRQQRRAVEGIEELRKGIDRAAESVLGDETEALKIASNTLKELGRQLDQEIQREQSGTAPAGVAGENPRDPNADQPTGRQTAENRQRDGQQPRAGQRSDAQGESQERAPGGQQNERQEGQQAGQQNQGQGGQRQTEQQGQNGSPRGQGGQQRGGNRLTDQPIAESDANLPRNDRLGGSAGVPQNRDWAPIAGDDFRDWLDRLRDVEEMIADPDLRAEAARILDRAKAVRKDIKRHSKAPNWNLVKMDLAQPLVELQNQVTRELLRRDEKNSLVPLNREPVPAKYESAVQKYYQQLGSGK